MTIKEVSKQTGISIDNLRYYERIGLIPEVPRSNSGIRNYDDNIINWIEFAMCFKKGGMPLEDIKKYISLALIGDSTKEERKNILLDSKVELEKKLIDIQDSLDVINYKLDFYDKKCGPITLEMAKSWSISKSSKIE